MLLAAALGPVAAEELPLPAGSRKNDSLGGATTLAPGKNYVTRVYETEDGIDSVTEFYQRRLGANAVREGEGVRFSSDRGTVRLMPLGKGTRITLIVGPQ
jgi:hypothetical protein